MAQSVKFFKVDKTSVYHAGYIYSFYRELNPSKSTADPQSLASFHCSLKDQKNCHGRVHTTANWETDKRGQKFQWGTIKNGNHNHEPEYRDTTRRLKFYKLDGSSVIRNGYTYSFYRELAPLKPSGDIQWCKSYRCPVSANNEERCRARIQTTGHWTIDERGKQYQLGTFRNCEHSHELQKNAIQENDDCNKVVTKFASVRSRNYAIVMEKFLRFYDSDPASENPLLFYNYKNTGGVHYGGYVYLFEREIRALGPWKHRMRCEQKMNGESDCNGSIWTTGKWEFDESGKQYKLGIVTAKHNHEPDQHSLSEDDANIEENGGAMDGE